MEKKIVTLCVMNIVFLLCWISVTVIFGQDNTRNTTIQQTKKDESVNVSHEAKVGAGYQPQSASSNDSVSNAEAPQKPLVIDGLVLTEAERRVFELTNAERQKRGLAALRLDRRLMESARRQASWMAQTSIFRHGNSGFAENIAMGQRSSREVVFAWIKSPGHFRNMMNRNHSAIGIGSYRGRNGQLYWCQQFSR